MMFQKYMDKGFYYFLSVLQVSEGWKIFIKQGFEESGVVSQDKLKCETFQKGEEPLGGIEYVWIWVWSIFPLI